MALDDEIRAIRTATALAAGDHFCHARIEGAGAFEALDHLVAADLYLQDGQMRPSLLLDEEARPFADIYVARNDESYYLLAEGPTQEELEFFLRSHFPAGIDANVSSAPRQKIFSVHGPYAWELCAAVFGPDIGSLPYLAFYEVDDVTCFRGGKTGEYGYDLLVPEGRTEEVRAAILDAGAAFDLVEVGLDALDQCALENGFFNVRREGKAGLSPLELGLQWRVSYRKEYVGSAALRARREAGFRSRVTTALSLAPLAEGDEVFLDDDNIGKTLSAGYCSLRGQWVGLLLLDRSHAYPGIDCYEVSHGGARHAIRTVSPPVLNNRSAYVSPQRHSYLERDEAKMPPLMLGS